MCAGLATQLPADTPLADELAAEELVETANLTTAQTGVSGTIFISTLMRGHGPRVKYFVQPGRNQPSFSVLIADPHVSSRLAFPAGFFANARQRLFDGLRSTRMRCSISGTTATPGQTRRSPRSSRR